MNIIFRLYTNPVPLSPRLGHYRILTDVEFMGMSRTAAPGWTGLPSTPMTCRFDADQLSQVTISFEAQVLVHSKNDPNHNFNYVTGASNGWANSGQYPKVTPIGFGNNRIDVVSIDDVHKRAQIRTWNGETDDPYVIHHWWNINYNGGLFEAHNGLPGYVVLDYPDPCYVDLDRIIKVL